MVGPFVIIGAQSGGGFEDDLMHGEADLALMKQSVILAQILAKHVSKAYCTEVTDIGLILRIDGQFTSWGESGLRRLRLAKKKKYITVDICFAKEDTWRLDFQDLRLLLFARVKEAIALCCDRMTKERLDFRRSEFEADLKAAIEEIEGLWELNVISSQ